MLIMASGNDQSNGLSMLEGDDENIKFYLLKIDCIIRVF